MDNKMIWDPLRKKEVALTPEEKVRQWFIVQLNTVMNVPLHMMRSEASFNFGDKLFRSDIIIYDRKAQPVAIVECKRPETPVDRTVLDQTIRYNMALNVKYIMITNGKQTFICKKTGSSEYEFTNKIPVYEEMIL